MRELTIDFEQDSGARQGLAIPLLAAALALVFVVAGIYRDTSAALEYWNDEAARLRNAAHTVQGPVPPRSSDEAGEAELKRAREIARQLALPWDQLFRAVEAATPSNVALLGVEPNAQKHTLRLSGEGKDIHAILAYVQRLEAQPVLRDVYLLDHETADADPQRPARFIVEAAWRAEP